MEEAKYPSRAGGMVHVMLQCHLEAWYPFSAAGITICQLLAVHLRLHARPMLGPATNSAFENGFFPYRHRFKTIASQPQRHEVKTLPAAHPLAMKRFLPPVLRIRLHAAASGLSWPKKIPWRSLQAIGSQQCASSTRPSNKP